MTLREFLRTKTNVKELCVICEDGWIVASFWIDYEDLFCGYLDNKLGDKKVKLDTWDYLPIVNGNNAEIKIPCHYIEV
jgi:hypothetical protein